MAFTGSWSCSPIAVKALMISDTSRGARRHGTEYLQKEELKQMLDQMALKPSNPQLPLPAGFVPPCLPTGASSGALWPARDQARWFRVIARKEGARVKLYSRPGNDLTDRFALARLRSRSCIIDGEAVACDERGVAAFDRVRYRRHDACVFLYAFDRSDRVERG